MDLNLALRMFSHLTVRSTRRGAGITQRGAMNILSGGLPIIRLPIPAIRAQLRCHPLQGPPLRLPSRTVDRLHPIRVRPDSSLPSGPIHRSLERIVLGSILGRVLSCVAHALVLSFAVGAERTELALSAEKTELALEASSTKPILDPPTTKLALHVVTAPILPFCLALRLAKTHRRATYIRMVVETGRVRAKHDEGSGH